MPPNRTGAAARGTAPWTDNWDLIVETSESAGQRCCAVPFQGFDKADNPIYTWDKATMLFTPSQDPAWNEDGFKAPQVGGISVGPGWLGLSRAASTARPSIRSSCASANMARTANASGASATSPTASGINRAKSSPGSRISPAFVNGLVVLTEETGSFEFFNPDGLYIGTLLEPSDMRPDAHGTDARYQPTGECWGGIIFKHPQTGRVYMVAQPNAQPLVLLYEVTGSDKVQYFSGTCRLSGEGK